MAKKPLAKKPVPSAPAKRTRADVTEAPGKTAASTASSHPPSRHHSQGNLAPDLNVQQAEAWSKLCKLFNARRATKSRETELIATRKDLDNQLNELGAGSTTAHLRVSREFVICLRSIKQVRAAISTLADKMEHVIQAAIEGKLHNEDFPSDEELFARPSEEDLFRPHGGDEEDEDQLTLADEPKPTRRRAKSAHAPVAPDAPGLDIPDETDQHLTASIEELELPDFTKAKLFKAGYRTIDRLVRLVDDPEQDLMTVLNCEDAQAKAIKAAVGEFRRRHRRVMKQADDDAAGAGGVPG